ncbi:energy-coupling factor ABC transporter ATP-binding protein [Pectinatus brassicae]|uniref:Cobalt/nickel transport system ATP-binding protein n=1 Tax=Pectinatus brassicae TaxID=862415 RepID=A0A840URP5_9FIRM|nr:ABC transporter ATP-binding protein [Pectinatus brassicae]MBB5335215.1 cobalt/nickel transport system ATP-binding protein [Pectinatus brassicae]
MMNSLIKLLKVQYEYEDIKALTDISLNIAEGEFVLLSGPNGAGKSTLFKLLNGLIFPTGGEYFFADEKITADKLKDIVFAKKFHKRIGYVFQNPDMQLFNHTVYDEIAFGPRQMGLSEIEIKNRVEQLLTFLDIEHLSQRAPYHLSGGEKKKTAIAAVLSLNPDILMMDEPVNGLDEKSRDWIEQFIMDFSKAGKTLLIASHDKAWQLMPGVRVVNFTSEHTIIE